MDTPAMRMNGRLGASKSLSVFIVLVLSFGACAAPTQNSDEKIAEVAKLTKSQDGSLLYTHGVLQRRGEDGEIHSGTFDPNESLYDDEKLTEWIKSQDDNLFYTEGVLQRYDKNGGIHLRAFGKVESIYDDEDLIEACYDESKVVAYGALRSFIGPLNGRPLMIQGVRVIHRDQYTHPITNNIIVFSVLDWFLASAEALNVLRESLNESEDSIAEDGLSGEKPKSSGEGQGIGSLD